MREQCFLVRGDRRGNVLRRDKTEVSRGGWRRWWIQEDGLQKHEQIISAIYSLRSLGRDNE